MGILFTIVWNAISKLTVSRLGGAAVVHPALSTPTKGNASWRMATGSPSGHGTWHKCICRALTNHFPIHDIGNYSVASLIHRMVFPIDWDFPYMLYSFIIISLFMKITVFVNFIDLRNERCVPLN